MADKHQKRILLLTLVHPDFLPPVLASAQVLRDEGHQVHILTFDSFVPSDVAPGDGITIESVGKHHDIKLSQRIQIRQVYTARASQLINDGCEAVIAFCAFTLLAALSVRTKQTPVIYHALEVADFMWGSVKRSPLSQYNNWRALRNAHKADLVATPTVQRSAWLAGRAHLHRMPVTILNAAYLPQTPPADSSETFRSVVPGHLWGKKIVLYTGAVNARLCIMELVQAFCAVNDADSALVLTGIKDNQYCNEVKNFVATSNCKERIALLPYVTRDEMLALQANAHIGVNLVRENEQDVESKMMAPNKVGEYLVRGLYLLGTEAVYMRQFAMQGIASLAATPAADDVAVALKDALIAISDGSYKARVNEFVREYYCMQVQMRPIIEFLKNSR